MKTNVGVDAERGGRAREAWRLCVVEALSFVAVFLVVAAVEGILIWLE